MQGWTGWGLDCGFRRNDEAGGGRRRGAGGVEEEEARFRGGARPRAGRNLDGRMHLVGGGVEGPTHWPPYGPPAQQGDGVCEGDLYVYTKGPPAVQGNGRNMLRPYSVGGHMPGFPLARE